MNQNNFFLIPNIVVPSIYISKLLLRDCHCLNFVSFVWISDMDLKALFKIAKSACLELYITSLWTIFLKFYSPTYFPNYKGKQVLHTYWQMLVVKFHTCIYDPRFSNFAFPWDNRCCSLCFEVFLFHNKHNWDILH